MPTNIVILGPQRLAPTFGDEIARLDLANRRVAIVTAGWQERERDDDELRALLSGSGVDNLELHGRAEALFEADPALAARYRARQNELRALQSFYRFRLDYTLAPARQLLERRTGPARWLAAERRAAMSALRALDRQHHKRIAGVHRRFDATLRLEEHPELTRHRAEVAALADAADAIIITGGHVAVLLNRIRLFGLGPRLAEKPLIAWSAGAMALSERVVLFHDSPPQGAGNAELLEIGLGLVPKLVPLPHARKRLQIDDPVRVALFARRFAPAMAVPLDENARLAWDGTAWRPSPGLPLLHRDGSVVAMAPEVAA